MYEISRLITLTFVFQDVVVSTLLTVVALTIRPVPVGRTTKVVVASLHRTVAAPTSTPQPLAQTTKVVLVTPTSLVVAPMESVGLLVPTRKVSTYYSLYYLNAPLFAVY